MELKDFRGLSTAATVRDHQSNKTLGYSSCTVSWKNVHIKIMHTFCNVLIYLKSLPSLIAPLMLCSYVTLLTYI